MAGLEDILKQMPIDDIAKTLGVDRKTARAAVLEGGQTIISGLHKEAQSPDGAAALSNALSRHSGKTKVASAADVDTADGNKILGHIFGGEQEAVVQRLGASSPNAGGIDFAKLLPILAPIIMNAVANRTSQGKQAGPASSGPDLGDLLGGMLGGGSSKGKGGFNLAAILSLLVSLFGKKK